jgi:DNA-binding IclR family transcriptional regulator
MKSARSIIVNPVDIYGTLVSSLENGLQILALLSKERSVLRVGEVCRELGMPKATVSRLLKAISEHGLIERLHNDQGYVAGRRALALSELYLSRHSLLDLVDLALDRLIAEFGFVGYVTVPDGGFITIIRRKLGAYPLRMLRDVGQRMPAMRTASGRAYLARMAPDMAANLIAAAGEGELEAEALLAPIRRDGVAITESTVLPGIGAVGAVVSDGGRVEELGLSISFPASAVDEVTLARMIKRLREEAQAIGMQLGDGFWTRRAEVQQTARPRAAAGG